MLSLSQGLSKADTFGHLRKAHQEGYVRSVHADTKDEMKAAKDDKDRRMIRSIDSHRREEEIIRQIP